jgi:hypothetical protein
MFLYILPFFSPLLVFFATLYWVKYKAKKNIWILLGIISPISWIILCLTKDNWPQDDGLPISRKAIPGYPDFEDKNI